MEVSIDRILDYAGKKAVTLHKMGQRIDNLEAENMDLREKIKYGEEVNHRLGKLLDEANAAITRLQNPSRAGLDKFE